MRAAIFALSIVLVSVVVNGTEKAGGGSNPTAAFIVKMMTSGRDHSLPKELAEPLGLTGENRMKKDGADPDESIDNLDRDCYLVLDSAGQAPKSIIFATTATMGNDMESYSFRASTAGALLRAYVVHGKIDSQKNGVQGSGVITQLSIKAPKTRALFQHELDFWLKDMYRTKLGKLRLTNPNATMADVQAQESKAAASSHPK